MTDITTGAGKRLHDARHLPDYCSDPCELREEVAAIEAEAFQRGFAAQEHRVKNIRAAERARVRERVEELRRKEPWPQFVTAGSMAEAARTANNNVVDDVLAILEEDTLVQDDR